MAAAGALGNLAAVPTNSTKLFASIDQMLVVQDFNIIGSPWYRSKLNAFTSPRRNNVETRRRLFSGEHFGHSDCRASGSGRDDAVEDNLWIEKVSRGVIHNIGDVVAEKYRITGVLGQGGVGVTYEAERVDGDVVALKVVSLRNMKGWKDLDLFEREARVLKSLKHPNIAEYIDFFQVDTDFDRVFYIAQKVAQGKSLEDLIESGWRVSEGKVKHVAMEVLSVLQYLGDLRPPVIHRDIKPKNIMLDEETGNVKVVDFGAVQDAASVTVIGSTVVGTGSTGDPVSQELQFFKMYGYMAPEQFQNRSTLQTDLYGLGGTMLYMISGRSPSYFPQKRLKVEFRNIVSMSPGLADIIERLLEPAPEDRFQSANDTIRALSEVDHAPTSVRAGVSKTTTEKNFQRKSVQRPAGTQVLFLVTVHDLVQPSMRTIYDKLFGPGLSMIFFQHIIQDLRKTNTMLSIVIPPAGVTSETVADGTFTVAWNAFIAFWTGSVIRGGGPVLFALFSLPFWFVGFGLMKNVLSSLAVTVRIKIEDAQFSIEWSVADFWKHQIVGKPQDISSVEIVMKENRNGRPLYVIMLREGVQQHVFGSSLQTVELEWLVQEIQSHLGLQEDLTMRTSITSSNLSAYFEESDFQDE